MVCDKCPYINCLIKYEELRFECSYEKELNEKKVRFPVFIDSDGDTYTWKDIEPETS